MFEWQTLVSGLLAFSAAAFTVYWLIKQISQSKKQEEERLRRQHNAARVTLPLTLSGLAQVVEKLLLNLRQARLDLPEDGIVREFNPPPVPMDAIPELQQIILSTDNPSVIQPIREIIIQIQTLWAKVAVSPHPDPNIHVAGVAFVINDWIIQAAKVYALIESLFEYARGRSQDGPKSVAWERVVSILMRLYIDDQALRLIVTNGLNDSPDFWSLS